jgi:hypothetical protein
MRCTGGLGLPLPTVLRRLFMAALLACLSSLALLVPLALAEDPPVSDPAVASDPAASTPTTDPATVPVATPDPAPEPVATEPAPTTPDPPAAEPPAPAPEPPAAAPDPPAAAPDPPAAEPAPFGDPTPVIGPVFDPPVIELPLPDLPDPVGTVDAPSTTGDPGDPAVAAPLDSRPARSGSPATVGDTPSPPSTGADVAAPSGESPKAIPDPVAVVIPTPDALAPASWRWPSAATPGAAGATPAGLANSFLSSVPPVRAVPSALPGDDGAASGHRNGTRHAPPAASTQPAPWSPGAPGTPVAAGAAAPAGAAGGLGGWAIACLLFVLLALAAPRRVLPRPALSPVLALRPAYAPARAPPTS